MKKLMGPFELTNLYLLLVVNLEAKNTIVEPEIFFVKLDIIGIYLLKFI